jgi:hypothetical protein
LSGNGKILEYMSGQNAEGAAATLTAVTVAAKDAMAADDFFIGTFFIITTQEAM